MNPFTAALIANGNAAFKAQYGRDASASEAPRYADLNAAIAACGGARGLAHRGRLVVTVGEQVFVWDKEGNVPHAAVELVTEWPNVAEAEAFCRRERTGDAAFRRHAEAVAEREAMDGPTGHGW